MVLVLAGRSAGPALGPVDDDEIGCRALLDHRLADRQQLVAGADAQLEPGRLAAGELAHLGDETDEFAAC